MSHHRPASPNSRDKVTAVALYVITTRTVEQSQSHNIEAEVHYYPLNSTTARDTVMTANTSKQSTWDDHQLDNGRWACPKCARDFATRKIARSHERRMHEGLQWPCKSKHTRYITSSPVSRRLDGRKKVAKVGSKSMPWRCTNSCGKRFTRRSGLSRHLREDCMKSDSNSVRPNPSSPGYTPVVSVRLQLKRLLGEKPHNSDDNTQISRSTPSAPVEKSMGKDVNPSISKIRQSSTMLKTLDRVTSTDTAAISSIIVSRDSSTFNITRITFKDGHDPRQPDYVQLYPLAKDTWGRIRCARAILCNQTTISDENAPADTSSHDDLLPILFRNVNFSTILAHVQSNYGQASNEELEKLKQEGLRQVCRYFGRDEPLGLAYTSPSIKNKLESRGSVARAGTPFSDTDGSESERSGLPASAINSHSILFSSVGSRPSAKRPNDSPLEDSSTGNKKTRLQSTLNTQQVVGASQVEGITF